MEVRPEDVLAIGVCSAREAQANERTSAGVNLLVWTGYSHSPLWLPINVETLHSTLAAVLMATKDAETLRNGLILDFNTVDKGGKPGAIPVYIAPMNLHWLLRQLMHAQDQMYREVFGARYQNMGLPG